MQSGSIAAISSRARSRARFSPRRCRRLHKFDSDFKPDLPQLVAITRKGGGKIGVQPSFRRDMRNSKASQLWR
jgi:hypothetical protein